jgi:hypothetical protein
MMKRYKRPPELVDDLSKYGQRLLAGNARGTLSRMTGYAINYLHANNWSKSNGGLMGQVPAHA